MKKSSLFATVITSLMLLSGCGGQGFQGSTPKTSTSSSSSVAPSNGDKPSGSADNNVSSVTPNVSSNVSSEFVTKDNLPEFDTTNPVKIQFWHTMGDNLQTALNGIITRFNVEYPNITVEHTQVGGYPEVRDSVLKTIPVDATPHLAYCYPDHVALYRDARAVEVLDEYITDSRYGFTKEQKDAFVPGFYEEGRTFGDGKMYSLPFVKSTEVLFYNKTEFAKKGYEVPTTWDELWALCEQIKKDYPNSIPLGYDSEANWFITNAEQNGYTYTSTDTSHGAAGHFLFNVKGNRDFVADLKTKYDKGLFTTETMYGAYTSGLFTATQNASLMGIGSTGGASYQYSKNFEADIAQIPQTPGGKPAVISQGPSICMLSKQDKQEEIAAWLFLKFLTTDVESQAAFAKASGYIPVSTAAQNSEDYKTYLAGASGTSKDGIKALAAKVAVEQSDKYFTSPTFVGSSQARDEVGNIIVNVLKGTDVQKAFNDAIQSCIEAVS